MNIYDFDETIYDSDSTKDFYFYCLKKYPKILLSVPIMAWTFFLYILGVKTKTQFKEKMYRFLTYIPDIDSALNDFWNVNEHKVKFWYKDRQKDDDIIISASPEFLLKPICERLGIKNLMASKVDKHTGLYDGENCWGEEKVKRLYEKFPNAKCEEFYSDSLSDTPLAELADKAMIIRGNELIEWNEYKPSKLKMFLSREFLSFLIVGGINTVSNVIFSTIYSLFIPNTTLAFFPGYITSNMVWELLNSKLTFKERLGFVKFIKFFISYIPNFIIQTIIVWLFDNFIHGPSVIAYAIAAIIGVPVTFVFMMSHYVSGYDFLVDLLILILGAYRVNFRNILKTYIAVWSVLLVVTIIGAMTGLAENLVYYQQVENGMRVRMALGICYPTDLAAYVVFLMFGYATIRNKEITSLEIFIMIAMAFIVFYITDARTDFVVMLLLDIMLFICKSFEKYVNRILQKKQIKCMIYFIPIFICALSWMFTLLYNEQNEFMVKLDNSFLSTRLSLGKQVIDNYSTSVFGKYIYEKGFGGSTESFDGYTFLDCSYISIGMKYGIAFLILVLFVIIYLSERFNQIL